MAAIVFCLKCASHLVDVCGWLPGGAAELRCCNCGHTQIMEGFTVARLGPTIGYEQAEVIAGAAMSDVAINQYDREVTRRFADRARGT
jgi:hypothetical protein